MTNMPKQARTDRRLGRSVCIASVLLLTGAACSGPNAPLTVGVRQVPTDVVLRGPEVEPEILPLPPVAISLSLLPETQRFSDGLQDVFVDSPAPAAPACPQAHPFATPDLPYSRTPEGPPSPTDRPYQFNASLVEQVGGAGAAGKVSRVIQPRIVQNVERVAYSLGDRSLEYFEYEVAAQVGAVTTVTTYRLVPDGAVKAATEGVVEVPSSALITPPVTGTIEPGLYIRSVETRAGDKQSYLFEPDNPLLFLKFPVDFGANGRSVGTDRETNVTMQFVWQTGLRTRVDACGTVLDAVPVAIREGRLTRPPDLDLSFAAEYAVATQYGGLIVSDVVEASGVQDGVGVYRRLAATITAEPLADCSKRCRYSEPG